jgi:ligand-binding sensor domain-containing protein
MTTVGKDTRHDTALAALVLTELGNPLMAAARMLRGILLHAPLSLGRGLWKGPAIALISIWFACSFSLILIVSLLLAIARPWRAIAPRQGAGTTR